MLACTACTDRREDMVEMDIPLSLCLSESDISASAQAPSRTKRVYGDPGKTELFALPRFAYIFIIKKAGDAWNVCQVYEETILPVEWEKERYSGGLSTPGDSIYRYTKTIHMLLEKEGEQGRVYAVASNKRLTFNTADILALSTESDVLNLKFLTSPDSIQENLQNIYVTPYNYIHPTKGGYYGSFDNITSRVAKLDLLLYHVAAKVDIKWNVPDTLTNRSQLQLRYMEVRRLYNDYAYCFKPMKNELAALPSSGYDIPPLVTSDDEGLWWEGRSYFYTIPYIVTGEPAYFPLQMILRTNLTDVSGYRLTLKQPIDTTEAFVPWLRGDFVLTNQLEAGDVTRTIGE